MRDAATAAKGRVEAGVSGLRDEYEPVAAVPEDDHPTIEVDVPDEFSFTDFDPGAPASAHEEIAAASDGAPAVRFDPESDIAVDDDGIPVWEDPA